MVLGFLGAPVLTSGLFQRTRDMPSEDWAVVVLSSGRRIHLA